MWDVLMKVAGMAPPVHIMGGFAEEVVLGERLDRPHKDIDLLVRPEAMGQLTAQLKALGLGELEVVLAGASGQALMLRGYAGGLELEAYVALPVAGGGFSIEVPAQGPAGRLRLFLPADTFDYPATAFGDVAIHTVSPLALFLLRAASAQTRHTGERRSRDLAMAARLRQTFLAGYGDLQLQPRIEAA